MEIEELLHKGRMHLTRKQLRAQLQSLRTELEERSWRQDVVEKQFTDFSGRLLFLADMHLPFARYDLLDEIFKREKKVDLLVLGGDILGFDDLSFFRRLRKSTFADEINQAKSVIPLFRKTYPKAPILLIMSNHEFRLWKRLIDRLGDVDVASELSQLVYEILKIDVPDAHLVYLWYFKVGDAVLGHRETKTSVAGRHVSSFIDWLLPRIGSKWKLRAVFQAHSHVQRELMWKGVKGIEGGCLCKILDWTRFSGRQTVTFQDLWDMGYAVGDFKDGKIDLNSAHFVHLDEEAL